MAERAHKIVSSENEQLILVDEQDNAFGTLSKARCHDGDGVLHRAFSVFLFDGQGRLLLQRRSADKRLWPLYWSNSCCSHPRAGESMEEAVDRRLEQELGVRCDLEFVFRFSYQARYADKGSENELCSVYLGRCTGKVRSNANEIAEVCYRSADAVDSELDGRPEAFTPWFRMEWERLRSDYAAKLSRYTRA